MPAESVIIDNIFFISFILYIVMMLECYVDTSHECAALGIGCIVDTWTHGVLLTAGIHFWVISIVASEAEQVVASEVDAHTLKEDTLHPFLWQSVSHGNILHTQE